MAKWKAELVIHQPIERVWELFSDAEIKRLFPKVESHELKEGQADTVGAIHAQSYMEGSQLQEYDVETTRYEDAPELKVRETKFTMSNLFHVTYRYILKKEGEGATRFIYEGSQTGVTLSAKAMLIAGNKTRRQETIDAFMERVELEASKSA